MPWKTMDVGEQRVSSAPLPPSLLLSFDHCAVGRGDLPCPRIVDPGVGADDCPRPMRILELCVVGESVV